jgi:CHAT domain-containing protein
LIGVFGLFTGAWSQALDQAGVQISEQERTQLRAILDAPIDEKLLFSAQINQYRQKDLAAFKLGDMVAREAILRAWMKIDPLEGKWGLFTLLGDTSQRAEAYQLGQELLQEQRWPPTQVRLRVQLARYHMEDNNLSQANKLLTESQQIFQSEMRNLPRRGDAVFWIARAEVELFLTRSQFLMRTGRWKEGIESAKMAVEKASQLSRLMTMSPSENAKMWSQGMMLFAYGALAAHQAAAGLYADAEWAMREAYQRTKDFGFPDNSMHGFYNRVSHFYSIVGRFDEALKFARLSADIVGKQGFAKGSTAWSRTQIPLSTALIGLDRWTEALSVFEQMDQAVAGHAGSHTGRQDQRLLRGYTYLQNGATEKALAVLQAQLRWNMEHFGERHFFTAINRGLLATALWKNGQHGEARVAFHEAVLGMTAPESLTGDYAESAIEQKIKRHVMQSHLQFLIETPDQQSEDAELIFQIAQQLNVSKVQQALAEAAVRAGVSEPGLSDIIRKEQDARNEIASLTQYITGQDTADEKTRTPQVLAQMRARLSEIEQERRTYKAQIQKTYPEYFQLIQPKPPSTQDLARQLQKDEVFLAVIPMEHKTYVWAINAQGLSKFHVADLSDKDLQSKVNRIRSTLDVAELGPQAPAFDHLTAHQIYRALIAPFEQEIGAGQHLIVSTSGQLARLPFAVLPRHSDAANPSWLIRDIAISQVPSANGWLSLRKLNDKVTASEPLVAWGDPSFDPKTAATVSQANTVRAIAVARTIGGASKSILDESAYLAYSKIPPLPETRDEVMQLARILQADPRQDVVLGPEATRTSVLKHSASGQMAKKRVVVFATHGLLAGDLPQLNQPALAMAATSNPQDSPLLTLEDVLGLRLNADWVVLSACNTAGADGKAEEALSGLARGFFYAGGRSLLVTHWAVETVSAMNLTTKTMAAYKDNPQIRRAQALRLAILDTMNTPAFKHPTFWAPYALVGEGGR